MRIFTKRQKQMLLAVLAAFCLNALFFFFPDARSWFGKEGRIESDSLPRESSQAVVRVVDGDTLELANGERVRLIGIDAPESVAPGQPVECYGKEASVTLKELLEGETVELVSDTRDRDRYGRLLRYVFLGRDFINERLVNEGYARAVAYPPDTARQDTLNAAEEKARAEGRGLWDEHFCPE